MALTLHTDTRTAMADALLDRVDESTAVGTLKIYAAPRPTTADTAVGAAVLLATVALKRPSFVDASGVLTIADPVAVTAVATGTAAWFRMANGDGDTVVDGKVGATGDGTADLTLATTSVTTGLSVDITGGTITMPAGSAA